MQGFEGFFGRKGGVGDPGLPGLDGIQGQPGVSVSFFLQWIMIDYTYNASEFTDLM